MRRPSTVQEEPQRKKLEDLRSKQSLKRKELGVRGVGGDPGGSAVTGGRRTSLETATPVTHRKHT